MELLSFRLSPSSTTTDRLVIRHNKYRQLIKIQIETVSFPYINQQGSHCEQDRTADFTCHSEALLAGLSQAEPRLVFLTPQRAKRVSDRDGSDIQTLAKPHQVSLLKSHNSTMENSKMLRTPF